MASPDSPDPVRRSSRRRSHKATARSKCVFLRLSDEEHQRLVTAARQADMATAAYAAHLIFAQLNGVNAAEYAILRESLVALMQAAAQVRKIGTLLNQAVTVLHSTGHMPDELMAITSAAHQRLSRVDEAAAAVRARLP